jgi:hypothetical protein
MKPTLRPLTEPLNRFIHRKHLLKTVERTPWRELRAVCAPISSASRGQVHTGAISGRRLIIEVQRTPWAVVREIITAARLESDELRQLCAE